MYRQCSPRAMDTDVTSLVTALTATLAHDRAPDLPVQRGARIRHGPHRRPKILNTSFPRDPRDCCHVIQVRLSSGVGKQRQKQHDVLKCCCQPTTSSDKHTNRDASDTRRRVLGQQRFRCAERRSTGSNHTAIAGELHGSLWPAPPRPR